MAKGYWIGKIKNGQYNVTIDLSKWMTEDTLSEFTKKFNKICSEDIDFKKICSFNGSILKYKSESLFPKSGNPQKKKVMIIAGNPATHSVAKGMFFYSKTVKDKSSQKVKEIKHQFWGKLEDADLIFPIKKETLAAAAKKRKKCILEGTTSDKYLLGLTTFYSFPTAAKKGVPLVERLFKDVLPQLQRLEYKRLISYPFSQNAAWVFMQDSSYRYVQSFHKIDYWPLMFQGSSGKDLLKILP